MDVQFADAKLERLATDPQYTAGFAEPIVRKFRDRVNKICAAKDERDLYALKSLHYEKLKGDRSHQKSMRLDKQWRLIVEIDSSGTAVVVVIVEIVDYH